MEQLDRYGYVGEFNYYSNNQCLVDDTFNLSDNSNLYEKLIIIPKLINIVINPFNDIKNYMNCYNDSNERYIFYDKNIMIYYKLYTYSNNIKIFLEKINWYEYFNSIVKELFDEELIEYIHNCLEEVKKDCDNFQEKILEIKTTDMSENDIQIYELVEDSSTNILRLINSNNYIRLFSKFNLINEYNVMLKYKGYSRCATITYYAKYGKIVIKEERLEETIGKIRIKLTDKIDETIDKIKIFIDKLKNIVDFDGINNYAKLLRKEYHNEYCIHKFIHKFEYADLYVYISNYLNVYYETKLKNGKIYYLYDSNNPIRGNMLIQIKTDNDVILDNESIDLIKKYQINKSDLMKKNKINRFYMSYDSESINIIKKYGIKIVLQSAVLKYSICDLLLEQERLNEKLESSIEIINILQNKIELLEKKVFRKSPKESNFMRLSCEKN
jgi:hypothetical protein